MTASPHAELDVIVLDVDGGEMLEECLTGLRSQSAGSVRLIVWDNGSTVPVSERMSGQGDVEVSRSEANLGFAGGANAALARSNAPFVALVNNDVVVEKNWAVTLLAALEEDADLAAVQSVILRPDGLVDGAGIDITSGTIQQRGHGSPLAALEGSPWGVSATATIYRSTAIRQVAREGSVFDERLFAYYEDVELCARLVEAGWKTAVIDAPLATHRGSASAGRLGGDAQWLRARNRWLVHRMHPGVGRALALLVEDAIGVARALAGLRWGDAAVRLRAVAAGLTTKL